MNELPKGWTECELQQVVDVLDSRRVPLNSDERAARVAGKPVTALFPYYGATGQVGYIDDYIFDEPLILLGEDGVPFFDLYKHKAYRVTGKTWVNNHAHVLKPIPDACDGRFLEAYLNACDYTGHVTGTTRLKLTQGAMNKLPIPLAPLPEQKRIADKLDSVLGRVDACRDRLDRLPALLKRFRQSILAAATSGRLTEDWRTTRSSDETQTTDSGDSSPEIPNWTAQTIGALCESSFYGPRFGKGEYTTSDEGVPTIRTTDMTDDGRIEITNNTPRVSVPANRIDDFKVRKGDLLVTRTGSIGVMAVFDEDYVAIPSAYLIRFRFKKAITPRYAFFCLTAPRGQEALGLSSTAITQPNVNAEAIKRIGIHLPPLEEQYEIVRRVKVLFAFTDRLEARLTTARKQAEQLTPALLAKAFRGELVPQDPNDEPATELLKRLATTRTDAPKAKRGRKAAA